MIGRLLTLETRLALSSILARTTFISQREIFVNGYSANFKLDGKQRLITSVDNMISTFMGAPWRYAAEIAYFENLRALLKEFICIYISFCKQFTISDSINAYI